MDATEQRLSNTQLEILKAFRHELSEEDLRRFRKNIADFFADILMNEADRVWDEQGWNDQKVQEVLHKEMSSRKHCLRNCKQ